MIKTGKKLIPFSRLSLTLVTGLSLLALQGCLLDTEEGYEIHSAKLPFVLQWSQCGTTSDSSDQRISAEIVKGKQQITGLLKQFAISKVPNIIDDQSQALMIRLGSRPSMGYSVKLQPTAKLSNNTLSLWIDEQKPPKEALTAQVMTSPCVVALLPKEDYSLIQIQGDGSEFPMKIQVN